MSPHPALVVSSLTKAYRSRRVVDDVSFSAAAGEITAVLGPNGAGKTTTIECCAGLRTPDSGHIEVLGLDRAARANAAELRSRVGVMVQEGGLPQAPTAGAVLAHVAKLHGRPGAHVALAESLGLTDRLTTAVRRLSGGERQRVAVGCAMIGEPDLLFLDEPSSGVDPHSRRDLWQLLAGVRDRGASIVVTTHFMDEAEHLADRIVVIDEGRIVANGTVAELTAGTLVTLDADLEGDVVAELAAAVGATTVAGARPTLEIAASQAEVLHRLTGALMERGLGRVALEVRPRSLENVFLSITRTGAGA